MSGSDRSDGATHLGGFGLMLAILLSALLVGFLAYIEGYQSEARHNRSYQYQEAAKRNALIACSKGEPAAVADCVYNELNSAQDQAASQQDLDAQQWMARWAAIVTILTGATTLISFLALRYIRDTFGETVKGAKAASDATAAMIEANRIARDINRAWVWFQSIVAQPCHNQQVRNQFGVTTLKNSYQILVQWQNIGNNPAIIKSVGSAMKIINIGDDYGDPPFLNMVESTAILVQQQDVTLMPMFLSDREAEKFRTGQIHLLVFSAVYFYDFGVPHTPENLRYCCSCSIGTHHVGNLRTADGIEREHITFAPSGRYTEIG